MSASTLLSIVSAFVGAMGVVVAAMALQWMTRQMRLSSALTMIDWLEEVRKERHILYEIEKKGPGDCSEWSDEQKRAAAAVCRKFDILGMLESLGYLDRRLVDRFYAIPARRIWKVCEGWLREERRTRGPHQLWEFEMLCRRVEYVQSNHPAIARTSKWPRDPRSPQV